MTTPPPKDFRVRYRDDKGRTWLVFFATAREAAEFARGSKGTRKATVQRFDGDEWRAA